MTNFSCRPAIKWTGSKRPIAEDIANILQPVDRYVEPFLGGGSVLGMVSPKEGVASDVIPALIGFWRVLRDDPDVLLGQYRDDWEQLQETGHTYYYEVRDRFNEREEPSDLLFLSRTCVNGLIRFNSDGEFNNSFHHTRPGIHPDRLAKLFKEWSPRVQRTEFRCCDFRESLKWIQQGDTVYLDPPYANNVGRYGENVEPADLFDYIRQAKEQGARVALSYDGRRGDHHYQVEIPDDLFVSSFSLETGLSPFKKVQEKKSETVEESLFLTWKPETPEQVPLTTFQP